MRKNEKNLKTLMRWDGKVIEFCESDVFGVSDVSVRFISAFEKVYVERPA
jgi:hypothetical protein